MHGNLKKHGIKGYGILYRKLAVSSDLDQISEVSAVATVYICYIFWLLIICYKEQCYVTH